MRTDDSDPEQEQEDLRRLRTTLERVDHWLSREHPDKWTVRPGSALAGDDAKSDPFQVSHAVVAAISVAVDHARALRRLINGCETCEPGQMMFLLNSNYTLLRGALENASRAVWLLAPDSRPERVLRRLQLQANNIENSNAAARAFGSTTSKPKEVRRDRVKEIAVRAGLDPDQALQRLYYKVIVSAAGEYLDSADGGRHTLSLWRACSGAAHGDTWAGFSLHDREIVRQEDDVLIAKLTAGTYVLSTITSETFAMIDTAHMLFDYRNRSRHEA